jgi:competence protein ComEA
VNDAIQSAGGFTADADQTALNLAEILIDGQQVNVPGFPAPTPTGGSSQATPFYTGPVNINTATLEQLDSLPGIGLGIAQDIIDYRLKNGPFYSIEDLLKVNGIGQAKFDAIKDLVTVGTSP